MGHIRDISLKLAPPAKQASPKWKRRANEALRSGAMFYHGTSSSNIDSIRKNGLQDPFLTPCQRLAAYYAREAADSNGGSPEILHVLVPDLDKLRYDGAAMDEPVTACGDVDEDTVQDSWNQACKDHPEWISQISGCIVIPQEAWVYSYQGAESVWYDGVIPPEKIVNLE